MTILRSIYKVRDCKTDFGLPICILVDKKRQSVEETREKLEKILDRNGNSCTVFLDEQLETQYMCVCCAIDKLRAVSEIEDDTWKIVVLVW